MDLTVAVGSLHVVFHVALLGEPDAAHFTLEGLLSSVFHHVDLQSALLVESLVALTALEGPLACVCSVVSLQLAALGERLNAGGAVEDSGFLGAGRWARLVHSFVLLQVCSSLKGLVTETADVTAVLAVSLPTVASQCVGILAHLITVVTLVSIISLRLAILPSLMAVVSDIVSIVRCSVCGLGMMADQYDLLT